MKSLRTGIRRILFLLRPWARYGKGVLLLSGFGHIVLLSISGYFVATVAQRIIDKVQNGGTFREALFIAIFSLVIVWVSSLLMDCIEDFYVHWKKEEVAGRIEQEIYKQALITDQRHLHHCGCRALRRLRSHCTNVLEQGVCQSDRPMRPRETKVGLYSQAVLPSNRC